MSRKGGHRFSDKDMRKIEESGAPQPRCTRIQAGGDPPERSGSDLVCGYAGKGANSIPVVYTIKFPCFVLVRTFQAWMSLLLFDDFVGAGQQQGRYRELERLCGL
jgi:hypothetical protein